MSIITLQEALDFLDTGKGYFKITAENDVLKMTSNKGTANIDVPDGTYEGDDLATALETAMNANNTLTGTGTITFSVSYSTSTYKFTIAIDEGGLNTITIDVSASDAALTFGFTSDPTATASIISDQAAAEDPTAPVQSILNGVDAWVKNVHCHRDFEVPSADYKEYSDGDGTSHLFLKQYPIVSVSRLSIGRNNAIKVNNLLIATYATVSVTPTGVVLNKDGTETTLLFTANLTINDMITAINAETNWQASVVNSAYSSYDSTELIEAMGLECLGASWAYLEIPAEPDSAFEVFPDSGVIHRAGGFPGGHRNIRTDYKAGYATLPEDLKLAVSMLVKFIYQKRDAETFGISQYSLGYVRAVFEKEMPSEARIILDGYKRIEV